MTIDFGEPYPDVTDDVKTWPVMYRYTSEDGRSVEVYDPMPRDRQLLHKARRKLGELCAQ